MNRLAGDLTILLALSIAVFGLVLFGNKEITNPDLLTHYQWLSQFHQAIAEGTWYPRWTAKAQLGLGELSYSAYPLYYYIAAALAGAGFDYWPAMKVMAVASNFLGGAVVYGHVGKQWGRSAALGAAAFWELAPFPFYLFSHYSALPWHFSLFLALELICLSLLSRANAHPMRIALTVTALAAAHVLVAFMTLVALGLTMFVRVLLRHTTLANMLRAWALPAALGAGLTAFHFVPAIAARALLNNDVPEVLENMSWKNAFMFPTFSWALWGMKWFSAQWIFPSYGLLGVGACAAVWRRRAKLDGGHWKALLAFTALAGFGLLLGSELALPLYALTFFESLQWPFRLNTVVAFGLALGLPLALACGAQHQQRGWPRVAVRAAIVISVLLLAMLQVQVSARGEEQRLTPALLASDPHFPGNEFTSIGAKWRDYAQSGGLAAACKRAAAICAEKLALTQHRAWDVSTERAQAIVFPLFAFPGWSVRVDGRTVSFATDRDTGLITLTLPAGRHRVEIELTGLPQTRSGIIISLASLLGLSALSLLYRARQARWALAGSAVRSELSSTEQGK